MQRLYKTTLKAEPVPKDGIYAQRLAMTKEHKGKNDQELAEPGMAWADHWDTFDKVFAAYTKRPYWEDERDSCDRCNMRPCWLPSYFTSFGNRDIDHVVCSMCDIQRLPLSERDAGVCQRCEEPLAPGADFEKVGAQPHTSHPDRELCIRTCIDDTYLSSACEWCRADRLCHRCMPYYCWCCEKKPEWFGPSELAAPMCNRCRDKLDVEGLEVMVAQRKNRKRKRRGSF